MPLSDLWPRRVAAITPIQAPIRVASSVPTPDQQQRPRQRGLDLVPHRFAAGLAEPEVEVDGVAHVIGELPEQGLVEPVVGPQPLDLLRGRLRQAGELGRRVAHHPEQEEVEDEDERAASPAPRPTLPASQRPLIGMPLISLVQLQRLAAAAAPRAHDSRRRRPGRPPRSRRSRSPSRHRRSRRCALPGAIVRSGS